MQEQVEFSMLKQEVVSVVKKVVFSLHAMKGSRGIAPLILKLGPR
jgi:hypothetical protein